LELYIDGEIEEQRKPPCRSVLFAILAVLLASGIPIGYIVYTHFYSMNHLPKGNWIQSSASPNQAYNLNLYSVNKGGGTNSPSVRGELTTVATGERKNIYWGYEEEHVKIEWQDKYHVSINNNVLDVRTDIYDGRRE
jgi:hypothetical protein